MDTKSGNAARGRPAFNIWQVPKKKTAKEDLKKIKNKKLLLKSLKGLKVPYASKKKIRKKNDSLSILTLPVAPAKQESTGFMVISKYQNMR